MRALEQRGHTVVWPSRADADVPLRELYGCDLVHCYRSLTRTEDLRKLSRHGVAISFDNDDNYAAAKVSDRGSGLAGNRYNREIFKRLLEMAQLSDITTTPSAVLADIYRRAGVENVAVIENHLDRKMIGFGSRSKHDATVLGWIAAHEHSVDLEQIPIAKIVKRLLDTHPNLRVLTVGLRLPVQSDRYEHVAEVPFPRLLVAAGRIDIGIAPLADIEFNRSRSNVKLKEYSSAAAAWLASPVAPYNNLGEQQGGRLVNDGDWFTAIDELVRSPRTRRRLARRALKWAKQQTIDHGVHTWESAFQATIGGKSASAEIYRQPVTRAE